MFYILADRNKNQNQELSKKKFKIKNKLIWGIETNKTSI